MCTIISALTGRAGERTSACTLGECAVWVTECYAVPHTCTALLDGLINGKCLRYFNLSCWQCLQSQADNTYGVPLSITELITFLRMTATGHSARTRQVRYSWGISAETRGVNRYIWRPECTAENPESEVKPIGKLQFNFVYPSSRP